MMTSRCLRASIVGLLASWRLAVAQCPDGTPPPCGRSLAPRGATGPVPTSVAVLYFETRDSADAYLADGLTEEIATSLGRVPRLQVKSPSAVRRVQHANEGDLRAIGRGLNVYWVVEGSVRRAGDQLRVSARLVNAASETATWSDAFTRPTTDLLAIQADLARQVATGIAGRLAPAERSAIDTRPRVDPEAYDHFLRGNYALGRRSPAGAQRAIAEYETAGRLDPGFARAQARISLTYALFIDWGWPLPGVSADSLLALGLAAANRALEIDSLSADAWMARGSILRYARPTTYEGAVPAFERALALEPRNAEAWHQYGGTLVSLGRDSAAMEAFRRALQIEPARAITWENMEWTRYVERRFAEAEALADSGLAADPEAYYLHADRAVLALTHDDTARARREIGAVRATRPPDYEAWTEPAVVAFEVRMGDSATARGRIARLAEQAEYRGPIDLFHASTLALGYVRLGDYSRTLEALERLRPHGLAMWYALRDPAYDPVRSDPRFQRLQNETRPPGLPR